MASAANADEMKEKETDKESKKPKDLPYYLAWIGIFWLFVFVIAVATQAWTYLEGAPTYSLFRLEPIPIIIMFGWIPYFLILFLIAPRLQRPK